MTKISDLLHQQAKTPHNECFGACQNLGCSEGTLGDAEKQFRTEEIRGVGQETYCSEAHEPSSAGEVKTVICACKSALGCSEEGWRKVFIEP